MVNYKLLIKLKEVFQLQALITRKIISLQNKSRLFSLWELVNELIKIRNLVLSQDQAITKAKMKLKRMMDLSLVSDQVLDQTLTPIRLK